MISKYVTVSSLTNAKHINIIRFFNPLVHNVEKWPNILYCPSVLLFIFFSQTTQAYAFIPSRVVTHHWGSEPLPPMPKNWSLAQNDLKLVFIKYDCVIYHWKAHGIEISKSPQNFDLPQPKIGPRPKKEQKWVITKYGRVKYCWKAHGKEIPKRPKIFTCPTHFLLPYPKISPEPNMTQKFSEPKNVLKYL